MTWHRVAVPRSELAQTIEHIRSAKGTITHCAPGPLSHELTYVADGPALECAPWRTPAVTPPFASPTLSSASKPSRSHEGPLEG